MRTKAIWAALAILCAARPALADDCKPLRYFMGLPITFAGGAILIPMTLNQKPEMMMLDTGGTANQLTHETVKALGLRELDSDLRLIDVSGNESRTYVVVKNAVLGGMNLSGMEFQVATMDNLSNDNIAGLISNSLLHALDLDLDFGANRVNFFSPDHCAGKAVYWPTNAVAAVPIRRDDASSVTAPVEVDGHPFRAVIDTGTTFTTMSMTDAKRVFDLSPGASSMIQLEEHPNGDKNLTVYRHTFSTLSFGGVTVNNPAMQIMPDRVNSKIKYIPTGSHMLDRDTALPQILIGLDILRKLHIYFSYREGVLYIAPADDKAESLLPAVAGQPAAPAPATAPVAATADPTARPASAAQAK